MADGFMGAGAAVQCTTQVQDRDCSLTRVVDTRDNFQAHLFWLWKGMKNIDESIDG